MADIEKIKKLLSEINSYGLETVGGFHFLSTRDLTEIYNGCGPDWLNDKIRDALTNYYDFFEAGFLDHDVSFHFADGTEQSFTAANKRLYSNCRLLVAGKLSWWRNPREKARRYIQAWIIYRACQRFGWSTWKPS